MPRKPLRWRRYAGDRIESPGFTTTIDPTGWGDRAAVVRACVWQRADGTWWGYWEEDTPGTTTDHHAGPFATARDARAAVGDLFARHYGA